MRFLFGCWTVLFLLAPAASAADVFERHLSSHLQHAAQTVRPVAQLAADEAARLQTLAANIGSPCLVIKTDDGNWTKALVAWGLRKGGDGEAIPVLLIERYVTYRSDRENVTTASGRDVMLFAGFGFNFDIGQVVPAGQGADVEFTGESLLQPVGDAEILPLDGPQLPEGGKGKHDPNDHDGVLPRDFSGVWKVNADGRWTGEWDLTVDENGTATGTYTSHETKSTYAITGKVSAIPNRIRLEIELANAQQSIDAYLWTTDKTAMAGTLSLIGRKFGFYALRQPETPHGDQAAGR